MQVIMQLISIILFITLLSFHICTDIADLSIIIFFCSNIASEDKTEKDEVVDSGISADKSESTSSDDPLSGPSSGPTNHVITVGPSGSNVRTILLNIRQTRVTRNYRKRKTPDRDSDNNDSSRDSDDLSTEEILQPSRETDNTSDADSDELQQLMATFSDGSPSA